MIFTERTVKVSNGSATIDAPIILYRGDRQVEILFRIIDNKYKFSDEKGNYIKNVEASFGQLAIDCPDIHDVFTEVAPCIDGAVVFTITSEMIDEINEVGLYSFHIRLFNDDKTARVTIPPIMEGIEIREPIVIEGDVDNADVVGDATVGYSMVQTVGVDEEIFDEDGNYIPTVWSIGDKITAEKLNKAEEGIRYSVERGTTLEKDIMESVNAANTANAIHEACSVSTNLMVGCGSNYTIQHLVSNVINDKYIYNLEASQAELGANGKIIVHAGGYYFYRLNAIDLLSPGNNLYFYCELDNFDPKAKLGVQFRDASGTNLGIVELSITKNVFELTNEIQEGTNNIAIRIDNRNGTEDLIIPIYFVSNSDDIKFKNWDLVQTESLILPTLDIVKYVSLNGDNNNSGNTMDDAYATVAKAVENNATVVYMERGTYYNQETIRPNNKKFKLMAYNYSAAVSDKTKTEKVRIIGADKLTLELDDTTGLYKAVYSEVNDYLTSVFIDKTLTPTTNTSRPSYNAGLWETCPTDISEDLKLVPVLTLDECKNTASSFHYDGSNIYVNPTNNIDNKEYYVCKINHIIIARDLDEFIMNGIEVNMCMEVPVQISRVLHFECTDCEANRSVTDNGFTVTCADGVLINCVGYKNRNDAFNFHMYGNTTLINCFGYYNYDDGCSHHECCTGTIIGGEYHHNFKGGIIPVNGAVNHIYNARCYNNEYGIYLSVDSGYTGGLHIVSDCQLYDNSQYGLYTIAGEIHVSNTTTYNNGGHGICSVGSNILLNDVTTFNNKRSGISLENSTAEVVNSKTRTNGQHGMALSNTNVRIDSMHVLSNKAYGIRCFENTTNEIELVSRSNAFGNASGNFSNIDEDIANDFASFDTI